MAKSRTKYAICNIGTNAVYQIISLLLGFVSRTVFIKTLGISMLGINSIFNDVLSMLSLADLGVTSAMAFSFYEPLACGDNNKILGLVQYYKRLYRKIAFMVFCIGISITPFVHLIINTENEIVFLEVYYLLTLLGVVVSYTYIYKSVLITADQKGYKVTIITAIINVLSTIVNLFFLLLFKNYILYLSIDLVFKLVTNIMISNVTNRLYPYLELKGKEAIEKVLDISDNIKSMFIYKLSSVLLNATDNVLISMLVGTVFVGYYSNYLLIVNKIRMLSSVIFNGVTAGIGNIIATENEEKRYSTFVIMQRFSDIFCGVVTCLFISMINDLIRVWLGADYLLDKITVVAIALNLYMSIIMQPLWVYREATGIYKKTKWVMLNCAIINLVLSVILGIYLKTAGILLASVVSRLFTNFIYEPKILFREFFGKKANIYYCDFIYNVFILLISVAGLEVINVCVYVNEVVQLLVKLCLSIVMLIVIYGVMYHKACYMLFLFIANKIKRCDRK